MSCFSSPQTVHFLNIYLYIATVYNPLNLSFAPFIIPFMCHVFHLLNLFIFFFYQIYFFIYVLFFYKIGCCCLDLLHCASNISTYLSFPLFVHSNCLSFLLSFPFSIFKIVFFRWKTVKLIILYSESMIHRTLIFVLTLNSK